MLYRFSGPCALALPVTVCLFLPGTGLAQRPPAEPDQYRHLPESRVPEYRQRMLNRLAENVEVAETASPFGGSTTLIRRRDWEMGVSAGPGFGGFGGFGDGTYHSGWPYGPRVAPSWTYPGLAGGPFVGYPWGWPGYFSGRAGQNWSNGLSLYGPPVPTYGPIPGVFGNNDLLRQWKAVPSLGLGFGWVGLYAASPRPRPLTVNVWPTVEPMPALVQQPVEQVPVPAPGGGCLYISVKLPQPAAELLVDGVRTSQTGTDRLFESPVLAAGTKAHYELTARWVEGGVMREIKKAVVGVPGEVVRVDFTSGN